MAYRDFNDLTRRIASDQILHDKAYNIAKNPKYDGINVDLLQWSINFLTKRLQVEQLEVRICQTRN